MKWYPWLNVPYQKILKQYQQERGHHALLLHSQYDNGEISLCYALSCWLMCEQQRDKKSCGLCHSCQLIKAGNHPDLYKIKYKKNDNTLGREDIYSIITNIYNCSHQGKVKVVWIIECEQLTDMVINALLKILEEPPRKTYFFLTCQNKSRLSSTLKSRCLYWPLPIPEEKIGVSWLIKKEKHDNILSVKTALRLCCGAPLSARILLYKKRWKERLALCTALKSAHVNGHFLDILPFLNKDQDNEPLYWLLTLISDALKWKEGMHHFLINVDKKELVKILAEFWSVDILYIQWKKCLYCFRQFQEISSINRELLLTRYLLGWERSIFDFYTTF